jgi:hypothetical protein
MNTPKQFGLMAVVFSLLYWAIIAIAGEIALQLDIIVHGAPPCLHHCIGNIQQGWVNPFELWLYEFSLQLGVPFTLFSNITLTFTIGLFAFGVASLILGFTGGD